MAEKEKPGTKNGGKRVRPEAGRAPRPDKGSPAKGKVALEGGSRPSGKSATPGRAIAPPRPPVAGKVAPATRPGGEQVARAKGLFQTVMKYLRSVRAEFARITWPTKQELRAATIVVVATLVVVTFYLYVVDLVIAQFFTRVGGVS